MTIGEKEAARRHAREQALLSPRGAGGVRQGDKMSLSTREGVKPATGALAHLSRAVLLLEQSRDLAEVASIRDMVLAADTYASPTRPSATPPRSRSGPPGRPGSCWRSIELPARCHACDSLLRVPRSDLPRGAVPRSGARLPVPFSDRQCCFGAEATWSTAFACRGPAAR